MRDLTTLDKRFVRRDMRHELAAYGTIGDKQGGAFWVRMMTPSGPVQLAVIASSGEGWDHVSVSLPNRCPTWKEMAKIAELFFEDGETLMQVRPPLAQYVNTHPHCLHWWRPHEAAIPMPPLILV